MAEYQSTEDLVAEQKSKSGSTQSLGHVNLGYGATGSTTNLEAGPSTAEAPRGGGVATEDRTASGLASETSARTQQIYTMNLYARIRKARVDSPNTKSFVESFLLIVLGSLLWMGCLFGTISLPIAMITIGSIYVSDCPAEPMLPIFVIVLGVLMTLSNISNIVIQFTVPPEALVHGRGSSSTSNRSMRRYFAQFNAFINILIIGFFIAVSIAVYGQASQVQTEHSDDKDYCHYVLYYFTYWIVNLTLVFLGFVLITSIIGVLVAIFCPTC